MQVSLLYKDPMGYEISKLKGVCVCVCYEFADAGSNHNKQNSYKTRARNKRKWLLGCLRKLGSMVSKWGIIYKWDILG